MPIESTLLRAVARDAAGNSITLGAKTITASNASASKPFGTIDTPGQGVTVSGTSYVNFGWTLTPTPFGVPISGSTLIVFIDGKPQPGHVTYNNARMDIQSLFPGYVNTNGAVGYYYIDTTAFINGVHTIAWSATDDGARADGLGSRYFNILNLSCPASPTSANQPKWQGNRPAIRLKRGFDLSVAAENWKTDDDGLVRINVEQMERLEIHFGRPMQAGTPLPPGSTLENGVFYWDIGAPFLGEFTLVFQEPSDYTPVRLQITVGHN